ncbi:MAG: CDP-diacylglycerol--glycerol-3-phosphate 3-phosphatidyltransferase [Treponema sp.]|nr:CDP-diacylglycerol--glycerol-3-phosphate 3-phosphatidyltransferase [Treponema sp.]
MKASNKFTAARIIAAPVFFIIYFLPQWLNCAPGSLLSIISVCILIPLLAFAEFTDFLDGFFARKNNEVSDFGKMFDPFADVFLHLGTFTCFVFSGYMPPVLFVLILYREFGQSFLRMVVAKSGTAIAARKGGKLKTVFYVASCFWALIEESLLRTGLSSLWNINMNVMYWIGVGFFIVCVLLSYISFIDYLKQFGKILKQAAEDKGNK